MSSIHVIGLFVNQFLQLQVVYDPTDIAFDDVPESAEVQEVRFCILKRHPKTNLISGGSGNGIRSVREDYEQEEEEADLQDAECAHSQGSTEERGVGATARANVGLPEEHGHGSTGHGEPFFTLPISDDVRFFHHFPLYILKSNRFYLFAYVRKKLELVVKKKLMTTDSIPSTEFLDLLIFF